MGTLVLSDSDTNTKPNYAVSTVLAAAVAPADGELHVWVGNAVISQLEAYDGVIRCLQALRDGGWAQPVTLEGSWAMLDTETNVLTTGNSAGPTAAEENVIVMVGFGYTTAGDSNSGHVRRMLELYTESIAKLA